ncbi:dihydrolipoyl dehydrogenase family protein [Phocicoccus pinnipedialis]|uniref:Dihydrolipoyl dehydrogenase n=1 Tax=Phocicoccus pinnipedialis TaxID=110845 RepID=A0A6V7R661_9BACL|nr:NAD(P)/FAD-dependent oxidoreductase [Jeotgalicoccus pinnipedialis]MBP1939750.1 glutathione reductase (NADPH) [Jeotgalicoccus pinnipedialis]CAD2072372.1 Dihydrolipoyl dehydrogenase [Jeotgalicoccus pinnipedialis]
MSDFQYDVIYIGSGHAAWHGALLLNKFKKKVAIIEKDRISGTCTNYGCNPKILLEGPFEAIESMQHYGDIFSNFPEVSWPKLIEYKQKTINPLHEDLESIFKEQGIDIIKGAGQLVDENTVLVDGKEYTSKYIVLATGQRSNELDIEGNQLIHYSADFLDLKDMPKRITFIGGGFISIEFASIAIKTGSEVSVIVHSDKVLKQYHQPYVNKLIEKLKNEGVSFYFEKDIKSVEKVDTGLKISDDNDFMLETDYVVNATGRIPNVENIGLENVGIDYDKDGIKVNKFMQTNFPNIYASGDVVSKKTPKLTPTATFESNYIGVNILGSDADKLKFPLKALKLLPIKYPAIPNVVYSLPKIAQVGMTVENAEKKSGYKVKTIKFGEQLEFQYKHETDAEMKIVLDRANKLKGAVIYGSAADDLVNILTFIIEKKMSGRELNKMIFAFPSASSGIIQLLGIHMMGVEINL